MTVEALQQTKIADSSATVTADHVYPSRAYAYFVILMLMLVSFQSRLDQQLPALLVGPIKKAFLLSDTQVSLVQGISFALFYAIMGPFCGILIDRSNRRNLIVAGILVWSGMTIWSGLVTGYWQLLVSRGGVGIGEAVLAPAAYSLIADYVRPGARARALAIFMSAFAAGAGFSFIIGGAVIGAISRVPYVDAPVLGHLEPWRVAFLAVGTPGIVAAVLMFLVREPARLEDGSAAAAQAVASSYGDFLNYVWRNGKVFALVTVSLVGTQYIINALLAWLPTFFTRQFHMPLRSLGLVLGLLFAASSIPGFLLSGVMSDRWMKRGDLSGRLRPIIVATMVLVPSLALWPIMRNAVASFAILGLAMFAVSVALATLPATLQEIAPNRMRAKAVTLIMLVGSLIGWGASPTVPALFTDYVFRRDDAIGYSLIAATVPVALLILLCAWIALRPYADLRGRLLTDQAAVARVPAE